MRARCRRRLRQKPALRRAPRAALAVVLVGVTALSAAGCSRSGVLTGTALAQQVAISTGDKPIRPGFEIGLLDDLLDNSSNSTLVIESVSLSGPGIGTVVRPIQVEIAPLRFGRSDYELNATPGALYQTDPPVNFAGSRCYRQALFPVKGFRMTPGSQARIWIVLQALRPGRWVIPVRVVNYTVGGVMYRQNDPVREYGSVASNATYIPPYWAMAKCVGRATGARLLSGYHLGKISG